MPSLVQHLLITLDFQSKIINVLLLFTLKMDIWWDREKWTRGEYRELVELEEDPESCYKLPNDWQNLSLGFGLDVVYIALQYLVVVCQKSSSSSAICF